MLIKTNIHVPRHVYSVNSSFSTVDRSADTFMSAASLVKKTGDASRPFS